MKLRKFDLLASHGAEPPLHIGWAMVGGSLGPTQLVSTVPLNANTTQRYFLKENGQEPPFREFAVVEELTSEEWAVDPAPHLFEIELVQQR